MISISYIVFALTSAQLFLLGNLREFVSLQKQPVLLIGLWSVSFLIFLSFIPTWSRYLLVVLPFMYNLAMWSLLKSTKSIKSIKRSKR